METRFALDQKTRQLKLLYRKELTHPSGLCLKVNGAVNTVTSKHAVRGSLFQFLTIPLFGSKPIPPPLEPHASSLRLGVGAKASGGDGPVEITYPLARPPPALPGAAAKAPLLLSAQVKPRLLLRHSSVDLRGRSVVKNLTEAVASASADADPRTKAWAGVARGELRYTAFALAGDTDLRLTAGIRAPLTRAGVGRAEPYLRVQENCWSLTVARGGTWGVTYDL